MPIINPTLPADGDTAVVEPYNAAFQLILGVLNGAIDSSNLAAGAVGLANLSSVVAAALVPTGSLFAYGGGSAPTGYLMCDGSSQLRASYSSLFAVIGTSYGSADGTHFNLPDLRGRVPIGNDAMGGTAASRTQRSTTLTTTIGSPTATVGSVTGISVGMFVTNVNVTAGTTVTAISGTTLTLSANATANGSGVAATFSMIQNAVTLGSAGGTDVHTLVTAQLASHTHGLTTRFSQTAFGANEIAQGNSAGNLNTTQTTASVGSDQPHPNMQPSLVTNYIIKI